MKVLVLHNYYKYRGGEDCAAEREMALLKSAGHNVAGYFRNNKDINADDFIVKVASGARAIWAPDSYRDVMALLVREKPDVAHFHNTFPLISPSAYYACRNAAVPVVQTLHNYRLFCAPGTLFRDGHVCEECIKHGPFRGVRYKCYRRSRLQTLAASITLSSHRMLRTWTNRVECFIAPSNFVRDKFVQAGFPGEKVVIKPNFVDRDPGKRTKSQNYALFVGRLTEEKGVRLLIDAWSQLKSQIPLLVVGDGPMRGECQLLVDRLGLNNISFCGPVENSQTIEIMKGAKFLIFPSQWYETFGTTIVEAFACGVPVICANFGAMQELVCNGRTGLHFSLSDSTDLARKVDWAWLHTEEFEAMGNEGRKEYELKYTPNRNYNILMAAYDFALQGHLNPLKTTSPAGARA